MNEHFTVKWLDWSRMLDAIANIEFKELKLNKGQYNLFGSYFENEGIILND